MRCRCSHRAKKKKKKKKKIQYKLINPTWSCYPLDVKNMCMMAETSEELERMNRSLFDENDCHVTLMTSSYNIISLTLG